MMVFYEHEHEEYRTIVRDFIARQITPQYPSWEAAGQVDEDIWAQAAELGMLGLEVPEEHGGMGLHDWRFRLIVIEEFGLVGAGALSCAFSAHDDMVIPALLEFGTAEQQQLWLPALATGEAIGAIAVTEPGAGSDLGGLRATAADDGSEWILNGQKAFVSNGRCAKVLVVAANIAQRGLTLFLVDGTAEGLERGTQLDKLGLHAQDTVEIFLTDTRVPSTSVLGPIGGGRAVLRRLLIRERLAQAAISWAGAMGAWHTTLEHVFTRKIFGQRLGDFQHTRFELAEIETGLEITRTYLERCVLRLDEGLLTAGEAAKAKWWAGEQAADYISRMLQLFGGYGFMNEYLITRLFRDSRVQTIYAGTTEVLKELIGREIAARQR